MRLPACDASFFDGLRRTAEAFFAGHPDEDVYTIGKTKKTEKDPDIVNNFSDPAAKRQTCVIPKKKWFHILGADFFCDAGTTIDIVAVARATRTGTAIRTIVDKAIFYFGNRGWRGCGVNNVIGELLPNTSFTAISLSKARQWCAATPRTIATDRPAPMCRNEDALTKSCTEDPAAAYARCAAEAPVSVWPLRAALALVRFTKMSFSTDDTGAAPKMLVSWLFDGRTPKDGYDAKGPFTFGIGKKMLDAIQANPATQTVYRELSQGYSITADLTGFLRYVLALLTGQGGTSGEPAVVNKPN